MFDYPATKQKLESEYKGICDLSIGVLLPRLLAKQVVTDVQMKRIEKRIKLDGKGMKFFIDNVILPTLGNMREKYRGFLETLEESDEECFQQMAKKLGKYVRLKKIRVNCDICNNFSCYIYLALCRGGTTRSRERIGLYREVILRGCCQKLCTNRKLLFC